MDPRLYRYTQDHNKATTPKNKFKQKVIKYLKKLYTHNGKHKLKHIVNHE